MKISISDIRWVEYNSAPNPDSYKGFKLKGNMKSKPNKAKLVFTNGEKDIPVIANSLEAAFVKAFDLIDFYKS